MAAERKRDYLTEKEKRIIRWVHSPLPTIRAARADLRQATSTHIMDMHNWSLDDNYLFGDLVGPEHGQLEESLRMSECFPLAVIEIVII
jgi:hypothetical protein